MSGANPGRGVIVVYVAAVVLGVLGMHSLDQHCPIPVPGSSHAEMHLSEAVAAVTTPDSVVRSLPAAPMPGGAVLCAAMLLAALTGLALAWALRRETHSTLPSRRPAARARIPASGQVRATGPPPVLSFVVIRC